MQPHGSMLCGPCGTSSGVTASRCADLCQQETFFALEHMKRDDNVRAAVWGGRRNWSSGIGIQKQRENDAPAGVVADYAAAGLSTGKTDSVLRALTLAFWDFPKPTVAAVTGFAVGGAANIALMNQHDLVVVSQSARIFYPFVQLGFAPELGSSLLLPKFAGMATAKELMLLGPPFNGSQAVRWGLANRSVPEADVWPVALELAVKLASLPNQSSLRHAKKLMNHPFRKQLDDVLAMERRMGMRVLEDIGAPTLSNVIRKKPPSSKL
ncbi:Carnitinyl-CoA dehydratase [Diplonema papillatum]|nr:Carnitinyl-CoA dehydratase [Diplonema papillatum]